MHRLESIVVSSPRSTTLSREPSERPDRLLLNVFYFRLQDENLLEIIVQFCCRELHSTQIDVTAVDTLTRLLLLRCTSRNLHTAVESALAGESALGRLSSLEEELQDSAQANHPMAPTEGHNTEEEPLLPCGRDEGEAFWLPNGINLKQSEIEGIPSVIVAVMLADRGPTASALDTLTNTLEILGTLDLTQESELKATSLRQLQQMRQQLSNKVKGDTANPPKPPRPSAVLWRYSPWLHSSSWNPSHLLRLLLSIWSSPDRISWLLFRRIPQYLVIHKAGSEHYCRADPRYSALPDAFHLVAEHFHQRNYRIIQPQIINLSIALQLVNLVLYCGRPFVANALQGRGVHLHSAVPLHAHVASAVATSAVGCFMVCASGHIFTRRTDLSPYLCGRRCPLYWDSDLQRLLLSWMTPFAVTISLQRWQPVVLKLEPWHEVCEDPWCACAIRVSKWFHIFTVAMYVSTLTAFFFDGMSRPTTYNPPYNPRNVRVSMAVFAAFYGTTLLLFYCAPSRFFCNLLLLLGGCFLVVALRALDSDGILLCKSCALYLGWLCLLPFLSPTSMFTMAQSLLCALALGVPLFFASQVAEAGLATWFRTRQMTVTHKYLVVPSMYLLAMMVLLAP